MKISLQTKFIGSLSIVLLCTLILALTSFYMLKYTTYKLEQIDKISLPQVLLNEKLTTNVAVQTTEIKGFLLTGDPSHIDRYKQITAESLKREAELYNQAGTEHEKDLALAVITTNSKLNEIVLDKIIPLKQAGKNKEALALMYTEGEATTKELSTKLNEFIKYQEEYVEGLFGETYYLSNKIQILVVVISVIICLVSLGIIFIIRSVIKPLLITDHH